MQISVENLSSVKRKMTVKVPAERLEQQVAARFSKLLPTAKLPGFRPGKAPLAMLKQRFGHAIRDEEVAGLVRTTLHDALAQEGLEAVAPPHIDGLVSQEGRPLEYVATFEVFPKITLADFSAIRVERWVTEVTETDVDAVLEKMRRQHADWQPVERAARQGDRVVFDTTVSFEGAPYAPAVRYWPDGVGEGCEIEVGQNAMVPPGFEERLVGTKAGDTIEFPWEASPGFLDKAVAGKRVDFQVQVREVRGAVLPPLDGAFAAKLEIAEGEGGVTALREEVRKRLRRYADEALGKRLKSAVWDQLLAANPFEIPEVLIAMEAEQSRRSFVKFLREKMEGAPLQEIPSDLFRKRARRNIATLFILRAIIQQEGLHADADRVNATVEEAASSFEESEEVAKRYRQDDRQMSQIGAAVLTEQAIEKVLARAQVTERRVSFEQVLSDGEDAENRKDDKEHSHA